MVGNFRLGIGALALGLSLGFANSVFADDYGFKVTEKKSCQNGYCIQEGEANFGTLTTALQKQGYSFFELTGDEENTKLNATCFFGRREEEASKGNGAPVRITYFGVLEDGGNTWFFVDTSRYNLNQDLCTDGLAAVVFSGMLPYNKPGKGGYVLD